MTDDDNAREAYLLPPHTAHLRLSARGRAKVREEEGMRRAWVARVKPATSPYVPPVPMHFIDTSAPYDVACGAPDGDATEDPAAVTCRACREDVEASEPDGAPCCSDPDCTGHPCTFPGYADNH